MDTEENLYSSHLQAIIDAMAHEDYRLHHAIDSSPEDVPLLIDAGADVNRQDPFGKTPLRRIVDMTRSHNSAERPWPILLAAAEALLRAGANPDGTEDEDDDRTSLQIAASSTPSSSPVMPDIAALLLAYGADANRLYQDTESPLDQAYKAANCGTVRALWAARGRFAKTLDGIDQRQRAATELALQCLLGNREVVAELLDSGIDVNGRDKAGRTALHTMAKSGDVIMTAYLLERGADIHAREDAVGKAKNDTGVLVSVKHLEREGMLLYSQQGFMPLHHAASEGHPEIVRMLLSHGADILTSSGPDYHHLFGEYPLALAVKESFFNHRSQEEARETFHILLDHLPSLASAHEDQSEAIRSSLAQALAHEAHLGIPERVRLLLQYGAGERRKDLLVAIREATMNFRFANLPPLWEAGQRLQPPLTLIETLPFLERHRENCIDVLLKDFPDLDLHDPDPQTGERALLWAVRNIGAREEKYLKPYFHENSAELGFGVFDHFVIPKLLIYGADPNACDYSGDSAISVAKEKGYETLLLLLEQPERFVADFNTRNEHEELDNKLWLSAGIVTVEEADTWLARIQEITWWFDYSETMRLLRTAIEARFPWRLPDSANTAEVSGIPPESGG